MQSAHMCRVSKNFREVNKRMTDRDDPSAAYCMSETIERILTKFSTDRRRMKCYRADSLGFIRTENKGSSYKKLIRDMKYLLNFDIEKAFYLKYL
jgi:hypothetical protein